MSAIAFHGASLIGGDLRPGGGPCFTSTSPADGVAVWQGEQADADTVDAAVLAARAAFDGWRRRSAAERIGVVRAFASALDKRRDEMTALISRETGKPLWDAATETAAMIGKADLSARAWEERSSTHEAPAGAYRARVSHRPHGVMAVLGPFNFPGHLPNGHIMPALIAGDTVVFKPSEHAPAVAELTCELWREASPPGVVNLVQGARGPAERLVAHEVWTASCSPAEPRPASRSIARWRDSRRKFSPLSWAATIR